jgi:hypothetical protein
VHAIKTRSEVEVQLHSLTSVLDEGQWWTSLQGRCAPRKDLRYLLGGPQHQSGHFGEEKILLPLPASEPHIVQPAALTLY